MYHGNALAYFAIEKTGKVKTFYSIGNRLGLDGKRSTSLAPFSLFRQQVQTHATHFSNYG
jgi:hypothetical protein